MKELSRFACWKTKLTQQYKYKLMFYIITLLLSSIREEENIEIKPKSTLR